MIFRNCHLNLEVRIRKLTKYPKKVYWIFARLVEGPFRTHKICYVFKEYETFICLIC